MSIRWMTEAHLNAQILVNLLTECRSWWRLDHPLGWAIYFSWGQMYFLNQLFIFLSHNPYFYLYYNKEMFLMCVHACFSDSLAFLYTATFCPILLVWSWNCLYYCIQESVCFSDSSLSIYCKILSYLFGFCDLEIV